MLIHVFFKGNFLPFMITLIKFQINNHPMLKFTTPLTQMILRCHQVSLNELADSLLPYYDERNSKLINPLAGGTDRKNTIPRLLTH